MNLEELSLFVQKGNAKKVKELVSLGLEENISVESILNEGLISAMSEVGIKFKNNEIYVPEMLIAARAMNAGMQILEPILAEAGIKAIGKAVIGTVKGDLHDIGKNLVRMMLKGTGIEVYDIGVDVSAETFADKAEEVGAQIVCLSALLTTTMPAMKEIIDEFTKRGIRDKYIFMIGGAPITANFAKEIGADHYTADAATAAEVAKSLLVS
ncbi:corrinoid protein [Clostridium bowmanii]|uniref:cobalamin B12-binding domain-containing protein n=1 Tax=Clostridium bowmanii TaxID=132925 RepID=UPI001C0D999F|nr:corrinoid protein [Clostridium bowmanii]MBU3188121.1 corrinoid protein [Clostridium bowmanii]MCA1072302.1 corrinoid protein [Clostridium bowmanii]